jgi:serine/threonine protein phosphatase PrpC
MQLGVTALSRPGARAANEDASGFLSCDGFCCCVIADGAGGHRGGAAASRIVVSGVLSWFRDHPGCDARALHAAIAAANEALIDAQQSDPLLRDMRSTVVALVIDTLQAVAIWGHLGDSRLYLLRGGRVAASTSDHSLAQQLIDTGYVSADELRGSIQRARLYAALGEADAAPPTVLDAPFPLCDGDSFLLCTDGWWGSVEADTIVPSLARAASADDWLRTMERSIVAAARTDQDNYSALAVWCSDPEAA